MKARTAWGLGILAGLIAAAVGVGLWTQTNLFRSETPPEATPVDILRVPDETASPLEEPTPQPDLRAQFDRLVEKEPSRNRTLDLPPPLPLATAPPAPAAAAQTPDPKAPGRAKRKDLPMGLILWDNVPVYDGPRGRKPLFTMRTGDIVRVYPGDDSARLHVHPGVDVFLAATTRNIEAAGRHYPDQPGWVDKHQIAVLSPDQAVEFTQDTTPITLSGDPQFSMLSFYDRAMKNPDPVVHRIAGPRLIELVSMHEDYVSSWSVLIRDHDSKIRSLALAQMKKRGVGNSRTVIEDLIHRLTELTRERAVGETEIEVVTIIEILKDTRHPRVPVVFEGFKENWARTQSPKILEALD